jgi:hypothetical protein
VNYKSVAIKILRGFIVLYILLFSIGVYDLYNQGIPFLILTPILFSIILLIVSLVGTLRRKFLFAKLIASIVPVYLMVYVSISSKAFGVMDDIMMYLIPRMFSVLLLISPIIFFGLKKFKWTLIILAIDLIPILLFDELH